MNKPIWSTLYLFLLVISSIGIMDATGMAQNQTAPPPQNKKDPGFNAFDFWVGEWNVYTNDGKRQYLGSNSIVKHYGDCLLKETWRGAQGSGGFSINYYNPTREEWRQVWVANGYCIDFNGGPDENGAMVLEGEICSYSQGSKTPFRGIWTPQADGSVIQHFDIYKQDAAEWAVWFEGLYIKKKTDEHSMNTKLQKQVADTERAFAKTMADRDHTAFTSFLSDEAIFFSDATPLRGKKQVAEAWKPYFEGPVAPFSWEPQQVEVLDSGTLALSSGPVLDPEGKQVATFNSIWRLEDSGEWRIIFDKGSETVAPAKK